MDSQSVTTNQGQAANISIPHCFRIQWLNFHRRYPLRFRHPAERVKMQQIFGKKVKMSLLKSYHSADAKKDKILVFKRVSNIITSEDFKQLLDFNKITNAEAERMKSKRTGRDLPFIKVKCDNPKQAEALILGALICQKTDIIFKVEEFRITPSIQQCFKC